MPCPNVSYLRARDPSILACGYPGRKINSNVADQLIESILDTNPATSKDDGHLQVYLRLKKIENLKELYDVNENALLCKVPEGAQCIRNIRDGALVTKIFKFSQIFGPESQQPDLFDNIVKQKLLQFINGFNCSLLTYGASGSGKTYTIVGTATEPGIIPRALEYLFRTLPQLPEEPEIKPEESGKIVKLSDIQKRVEKNASQTLLNNFTTNVDYMQHTRTYKEMQQRLSSEPVAILANDISDVSLGVWISFAEIYNENAYDLLTPPPSRGILRQKLRLGHRTGNAYIKGLRSINVTSGLEAYHLMQFGLQNLKYAATSVNDHSSRSHSIFTIKLAQASDTKEGISVSSFNFCDLAGSERVKKTNNIGERLKESNNINTSLLVLGRCVSTIRDVQKSGNSNKLIPFRESKLTQLFQRALLGHEAISMIVNINPTRQMFDESQHVLNFSAIAKDVTIEQQQPIQRPQNNKFSEYMTGRSTAFPSSIEEDSRDIDIEQLQAIIANLAEEIEQRKLDAKEEREFAIVQSKKLLDETSQFWDDKCKALQEKLASIKTPIVDNVQQQANKKRKHSIVVVLDSSSEGDDETNERKPYKRQKFYSIKKEQTELQIQGLKEENKSIEITLQDAGKAYENLQVQYRNSIIQLKKQLVQLDEEIDTLVMYENRLAYKRNTRDEINSNHADSLFSSENDVDEELEKDVDEESENDLDDESSLHLDMFKEQIDEESSL